MKNALIVGHCDLDNPQITSLIEKNFSVKVTRVKLFMNTVECLEKQNYDLVIINRIGAFDQESAMELIKKIKHPISSLNSLSRRALRSSSFTS